MTCAVKLFFGSLKRKTLFSHIPVPETESEVKWREGKEGERQNKGNFSATNFLPPFFHYSRHFALISQLSITSFMVCCHSLPLPFCVRQSNFHQCYRDGGVENGGVDCVWNHHRIMTNLLHKLLLTSTLSFSYQTYQIATKKFSLSRCNFLLVVCIRRRER